MAPPLVVLDFDGTFTDVEAEGAPFQAAYQAQFNDVMGVDTTALWREAEVALQDPEYGWTVGGHVVAPANCDPYIRSTCVAFLVCQKLGRVRNEKIRTALLSAIYEQCYQVTKTAFRPEADEVLQRLKRAGAQLRVVTNSAAEVVKSKLATLGHADIEVIGSAKKYIVDDAAPDVRLTQLCDLEVPGLKRAPKVRRPHYFKVLAELWKSTGSAPEHTLVCGDIFELDLALPLSLGTMGHLLLRPNTLPYERHALTLFGARATSSPSLVQVAERVEAMA